MNADIYYIQNGFARQESVLLICFLHLTFKVCYISKQVEYIFCYHEEASEGMLGTCSFLNKADVHVAEQNKGCDLGANLAS